MKLILILCTLLLAGCAPAAPQPTDAPTEPAPTDPTESSEEG